MKALAPTFILLAGLAAFLPLSEAQPKQESRSQAAFDGFSVLRHRTTFAQLPAAERIALDGKLQKQPSEELWTGIVRLHPGYVKVIASDAVLCMYDRVESFGSSACEPSVSARRRGISLITFCRGRSGKLARITGVVPDRVVRLRVERNDGRDEGAIVHLRSNAFTLMTPPVDLVLRGKEHFSIAYPLKRLEQADEPCAR